MGRRTGATEVKRTAEDPGAATFCGTIGEFDITKSAASITMEGRRAPGAEGYRSRRPTPAV